MKIQLIPLLAYGATAPCGWQVIFIEKEHTMSKLSLLEINQSQLDTTPVIDGQLIICLDTGTPIETIL